MSQSCLQLLPGPFKSATIAHLLFLVHDNRRHLWVPREQQRRKPAVATRHIDDRAVAAPGAPTGAGKLRREQLVMALHSNPNVNRQSADVLPSWSIAKHPWRSDTIPLGAAVTSNVGCWFGAALFLTRGSP